MPRDGADPSAQLIAELTRRNLRIAVAESLTGGLLTAELTRIPGASLVVSGGIVAYATPIKQTLLGVPVGLLATEGAVHPEVARAMAAGVRRALAVDGRPADIGVATTGVAGPDPQDGRPPGTVYVGIATDRGAEAIALELDGDRSAIRAATVRVAVVETLARVVGSGASRAG
jgi:nicotinamide-nucleotide amidase